MAILWIEAHEDKLTTKYIKYYNKVPATYIAQFMPELLLGVETTIVALTVKCSYLLFMKNCNYGMIN